MPETNTQRLRTSFTGYYGMNNFGDDLFGMICSAAAHRFWNSEARLVGPAIEGVDSHYTMPAWYPPGCYGASGPLGKASRLYSFMRAIRGSDVLVMGGGSVINARKSFRKPMMVSAQRRGQVELAAVGVSIGPFADDAAEAAAAEFIDRFAYISVRDRRSYELALKMGLAHKTHSGCDLAGLLALLAPAPGRTFPAGQHDNAIRIGVAPCNYRSNGYPAPAPSSVQAGLATALARLATARPLQVDIFSLNEHREHGDHALALALQQDLQQRNVASEVLRYRGRSPLDMVRAIGRCDAFVSARLHGAMVAYLQGVPFTIIDYHAKCRDFAADVLLPDAQRIDAERQDADAFGQAFTAMLEGDSAPAVSPEFYAEQAQDIFRCAPWSNEATRQ
jgi:polysaccharide pyruvyl transferase WcaK-like protein